MEFKLEAVPKICIVVLVYNCLDHTRACLASLRAISYQNYEIVVVDNGSSDGSDVCLPAEFPEVSYLRQNENLGFTGGNNIGIAWCLQKGCDAVLLLNNDTVVSADFLTQMATHLTRCNIVTPKISFTNRPDLFGACMGGFNYFLGTWRKNAYGKPLRLFTETTKVEMAAACCLLIPAYIINKVGLLDDNYFLYYEDADFITRARKNGFELVYESSAIISHNERTSTDSNKMSAIALYYNIRNRMYYVRKFSCNNLNYYLFILFYFNIILFKCINWLCTNRYVYVRATFLAIHDYAFDRMNKSKHSF